MTIGYECRTEVSYRMEWEIGDFVLVDHSIRCVVPGAEVRDEPKVYCVWLGYDVDGHSIHARQEVSPEGLGETTKIDLFIPLVA